MTKWLATAGIAVIALLVAIWYQLRAPIEVDAAPSAAPHANAPAAEAPAARGTAGLQAEAAKVAAATAPSDKIDPASDAFFYEFDDLMPAMATRNAAKCYTGGLHRVSMNQRVKMTFKDRIVNGEVTITDVKVVQTDIDDPPLVACFVHAVEGTHWHNAKLPDWVQDDELVISPERGMKKYTKENMEYEGDGPDFTKR